MVRLVMVRTTDANGDKKHAIQVDPYVGRIRPMEVKGAEPTAQQGTGDKGK